MNGETMSIVFCVRNRAMLLDQALAAIRKEVPAADIIVVDGNSHDNAQEVARNHSVRFISDEGKGLAYARQLGIEHARQPFVAIVGVDNIISKESLYAMQAALKTDPQCAAVAPQTEVIDAKSYWERATREIFRHMINRPGYVDVVGTPCMYRRETIRLVSYDPAIREGADDTDLGLRLKKSGYSLAMIDAYAQEKQHLDMRTFFTRWRWYGRGDAEFYAKHAPSWTLRRKWTSLTHPLRKYVLNGTRVFAERRSYRYIPALYFAAFARYAGWVGHARELRRQRRRLERSFEQSYS